MKTSRGIILILIGFIFLSSHPAQARRVRSGNPYAIIPAIEAYVRDGNYEKAKEIIYQSFIEQVEILCGLDKRPIKDEAKRRRFYEALEDTDRSILNKMTGALVGTSDLLLKIGGILPPEMSILAAKFGYLCSLLFVCELETSKLSSHTIEKSLPDFWHYLYWIDTADFMRDLQKDEEIIEYQGKTKKLLTEHLQRYLSKELDASIFNVGSLRYTMDEAELSDYVYYQTLATAILNAKNFDVPGLSKRADTRENPDGVNIVSCSILGAEGLAVFREGSKYPEANFIIVPHIEWLERTKDGRFKVRKGYLYTKEGLFFVEFEKPLDVHYCLNGLNEGSMLRTILEQNIAANNIPNPAFKNVGDLTVNKAVSLDLLSKAGISVPRGGSFLGNLSSARSIAEQIKKFMKRNGVDEIVIKPFNTNCGTGIAYFTKEQISEAADYILEVWKKYGGVKYEERIFPPKIDADGELCDWNLRVFLSRDAENKLVVSDIAVRYGNGVVNISRGAGTMTWERLISLLGISEDEAAVFREQVEEMSIRACEVIEAQALWDAKVATKLQEDFMSTDIICSSDLTPYIMELNDHYTGVNVNNCFPLFPSCPGEEGEESPGRYHI
ncbi:MAG: hypothetical protein NTZ48_02095 [Candidatus Omnitrophica bacterium]|nr:hypothetical protein [Candidatus Omnitrophota bacterium]